MIRTMKTLSADDVDRLLARAIEAGVDVRLSTSGTWRLDGLETLSAELRDQIYSTPSERLVAGLRRYVDRRREVATLREDRSGSLFHAQS